MVRDEEKDDDDDDDDEVLSALFMSLETNHQSDSEH